MNFRMDSNSSTANHRALLWEANCAAHDLRTALNVVQGATESLQSPWCAKEDKEFWLGCIMRNLRSMEAAVEDFQDGLRQQGGHLELEREEIQLQVLADEVVRDFAAITQSHQFICQGDQLWIIGDRERIRRLLFNLLSNAARYSGTATEIKVDVWRRGDNACIFVQDQGQGLVPAETERLFLPFTRLEEGGALADGQSLGLASVKRIADAHGATISVQGHPGRGTTVEICFRALNRSCAREESAELCAR